MTRLDNVNETVLECMRQGIDTDFTFDAQRTEVNADANLILVFLEKEERSIFFKEDIKKMKDGAELVNSTPEGGFVSYIYPIGKTFIEVAFIFNEERWNNF